ncbi:MAG TPA: hypothetical protein VHY09_11075 [Candidatus Methylacidiphilales bacterium]|jgi:hypothetical protein|nr:hypothetical protein [Candidatus Methylacidiphilales bacterium]
MKTSHKPSTGGSCPTKRLTLGDLVVATYNGCGDRAPRLLQLALASQLIRLAHGPLH